MNTVLSGSDVPLFLTVSQFALRLGLSRQGVHNLISQGKLKAITVGTVKRIPIAEFERVQREGC